MGTFLGSGTSPTGFAMKFCAFYSIRCPRRSVLNIFAFFYILAMLFWILDAPGMPGGGPGAPRGSPWCHCGRPLATSGIVGATFWSPRAPIWHHLDTPWRSLPPSWDRASKTSKRSLLLHICWGFVREGCTCDSTMPAQSKHTLGSYF